MSLPVRLNRVLLRAFVALELLLAMLPAEMLLDPRQVPQSACRIVVDTRLLRADVHSLPLVFVAALAKFPREIVAPPMKLQILIALEPFVAYFAKKAVCSHERFC